MSPVGAFSEVMNAILRWIGANVERTFGITSGANARSPALRAVAGTLAIVWIVLSIFDRLIDFLPRPYRLFYRLSKGVIVGAASAGLAFSHGIHGLEGLLNDGHLAGRIAGGILAYLYGGETLKSLREIYELFTEALAERDEHHLALMLLGFMVGGAIDLALAWLIFQLLV